MKGLRLQELSLNKWCKIKKLINIKFLKMRFQGLRLNKRIQFK